MKIADEIKSLVTMQQVAEFYGFQVGRSGFISCPFHTGDHTASLKSTMASEASIVSDVALMAV